MCNDTVQLQLSETRYANEILPTHLELLKHRPESTPTSREDFGDDIDSDRIDINITKKLQS
eukprot:TRINITY_DN1021_c0_g1_i3.p2 TRINITY_DN1021_c0_g1~~TRINITY_DN1021_c0_g1_i3.p2  ORF type:complete len:61 (-),score=13.33 TRINITY_DN1021_c0_g1_i3:78-260(-)